MYQFELFVADSHSYLIPLFHNIRNTGRWKRNEHGKGKECYSHVFFVDIGADS